MAPRGGIFTATTPSLADIPGAIEKIQAAIAAKTLKKKLFYEMLLGFQILEQSLQRKQSEAYNLILTWLNLFLNIQSNIITQNEGVREQFEKIVPSAVTYMIGCLQHKAKEIVSYHYQLLEMIHELLSNVRPGVLEKIATFETGIIACIWFPIAFVGDFNTQMMALRLLVMLLKCVDSKRLQNELDNIRCVDKSVMKNKLTAAISVANFHAAKFENTARDLLNTYNMHLAKNILVYSFRCKSFKFGDSIEFFKPMNADDFWMDFNYCPRTLSFNGCCQTKNQTNFTNCSVNLQILKLSLNYLNLSIHFEAPLRHGNESTNFPDIAGITTAEIILPREEAMRLLENKFVLKYYNQPYRPRNESIVKLHKTSTPIPFQCMENVKETTANTNSIAIDDLMFKSNNNFANIVNIASKDSAPPEVRNSTRVRQQQSNTQADSKSSPSNRGAVSKQFPKSFEFLIDVSKKINENVYPVALENNNTSRIKKSSRPNEEQNHQKLSHLRNTGKQLCGGHLIDNIKKTAVAKLVNYSTSASESQLSSQKSIGSLNDIIIKPPQRRFFKTLNTNSETETISSKTKRMCRKRNARQDVTNASLKKSKQVNEVKPMLHSSKELNQTETSANNNRVINITNSDSNANANSITIYPTNSCSSNLGFDEYEKLTVSDAEPGGSYHKFKTRRNSKGQTNNVAETQQSRKPLPRAVKKNVSSTFLLGRNSQLAQTKPVRKRLQCMDSFDEVKGQTSIPAKITKLSNHKNPTICSAHIKNIADVVIRCCTSYKQNEVAQNSLIRTFARKKVGQILNTSLNPNEIPKTSAQSIQINVTSDETDERHYRNISADVTKVCEDKINDIQECRQNLYHKDNSSVHDYEEFSDCPNFSQLIDISDMLLSSECESTVLPGEITHPTNTLKSSNKQKSSDLPIKIYDFNMLKPHKSSIYRARSDNGSDCEHSVNSSDRFEPTTQPLEPPQTLFVTPQVPLKKLQTTTSVTKRQVSTTSTSIVTQQGRVVHQKCVVNLPASSNTPINLSKSCSRATTTTTKTIVQEKKEYSLNNSIQMPVKFKTPTPEALRQESSNMISTHKCNLNLLLEHMETNINRNSANAYIKKICDVAERVINEVERERKSLLELRESIGRLARQLDWQHDAYRRKTQQFECFKQNIDTLLRVLDNINLLEEIETDTQNKIQHLQQSSNSIATQQWRNFINETTTNLLKDISTVSDL
ncbi:uncharacterized protein LOC128859705 isoform X1 [Anastrepha ludens]|uniref:uncharacterized protein LOC128859705 isoform X1 n=1 Tax=Anastrepha ludens TaxID=28586 RepID=UPI0023B17905|nr:uncharacterized protein LOC128859705 isoform X1 [Anastrepha ludens]XP_053952705.1 uncharacterized protein LOC128859705 isoform X1 [Anastrepha ludens]XP_053952706.1 uncharacterized protein LOC128859705 isoform X1 [Anastrepha ludens]